MRGKRITLSFLAALTVFILAGILWFFTSDKRNRNDYPLIGIFPNSAGLAVNQDVACLGQKIGYIKSTQLLVGPRQILIVMRIRPNIKIPQGCSLQVNFNSLLGSKILDVLPPPYQSNEKFCRPDDTLWGKMPTTLTDLQNQAGRILTNLESLTVQFHDKINQLDLETLNLAIRETRATLQSLGQKADGLEDQCQHTLSGADSVLSQLSQRFQEIGRLTGDTAAISNAKIGIEKFRKSMEALRKLFFWSED